MEKKSQIYLLAVIAYLIAGFCGSMYTWINSYWPIFAFATLVTAFVLMIIFDKDKSAYYETKFEWISVCALLGFHLLYTILIDLANLPFTGFFVYSFYAFQIAGLVLVGYSIVKYVLNHTRTVEYAKEIFSKRNNKVIIEKEEKETDVANEIESTIAQETTNQDSIDSDIEVVGVVNEEVKEPEVLGIELQEANNTSTPYMEEEI